MLIRLGMGGGFTSILINGLMPALPDTPPSALTSAGTCGPVWGSAAGAGLGWASSAGLGLSWLRVDELLSSMQEPEAPRGPWAWRSGGPGGMVEGGPGMQGRISSMVSAFGSGRVSGGGMCGGFSRLSELFVSAARQAED